MTSFERDEKRRQSALVASERKVCALSPLTPQELTLVTLFRFGKWDPMRGRAPRASERLKAKRIVGPSSYDSVTLAEIRDTAAPRRAGGEDTVCLSVFL